MNNSNKQSELLINFGKQVKYYRKQMRLSQEEVAKKLGYKSKASIAQIEAGRTRVPATKVIEFANLFNVKVSDLIKTEQFFDNVEVEYVYETDTTRHAVIETTKARDTLIRETIELIMKLKTEDLEKAHTILKTMYGE